MSHPLSLLLSLTIFVFLYTPNAAVKLPKNAYVPAVIVFGDSIVDSGNNNDLTTVIKANFPPYGRDFAGGFPTGRFCDGRVPSDLIGVTFYQMQTYGFHVAEELSIKKVVPAYLDPNLQSQDLPTGVSFASGGAGYDPLTAKSVSVIGLSQQLEFFKEYIEKLKGMVGEDKTSSILANSMYLVVAGSDDIANTYFGLRVRQLQYDVPSYTDLMVQSASSFLKNIYDLGARRVAVFSAPPIGCVPSQRTVSGGIERECASGYNDAAILFNSKLSAELDSLNNKLLDSKMVYIDIYHPLQDIVQNPQNYGFEIANKGCCGTGNIEVAILCNELSPSTCQDVSKYVFWDSYHPTEKTYKTIVTELLVKYIPKLI